MRLGLLFLTKHHGLQPTSTRLLGTKKFGPPSSLGPRPSPPPHGPRAGPAPAAPASGGEGESGGDEEDATDDSRSFNVKAPAATCDGAFVAYKRDHGYGVAMGAAMSVG